MTSSRKKSKSGASKSAFRSQSVDRQILNLANRQIEGLLKKFKASRKQLDKSSHAAVQLGERILERAESIRKHLTKTELIKASQRAQNSIKKKFSKSSKKTTSTRKVASKKTSRKKR